MQIPIISRRGLYGSIPRINWDHPLTRGLIGCYLPGTLRGVALIGPTLVDGSGGPGARGITQDGASLKSTTSGSPRGLTAAAPSNFKTWSGMPTGWDGELLTFQVSPDGTNFYDLFRANNTEVAFNITAGSVVLVAETYPLAANNFIKLRSGSRLNPRIQSANRNFLLSFV